MDDVHGSIMSWEVRVDDVMGRRVWMDDVMGSRVGDGHGGKGSGAHTKNSDGTFHGRY